MLALLGMAFSGIQPGLTQNAMSPMIGGMIGIAAIIVLPMLYGVIGFVVAFLGAWLYNLAASKMGGIEIDIT